MGTAILTVLENPLLSFLQKHSSKKFKEVDRLTKLLFLQVCFPSKWGVLANHRIVGWKRPLRSSSPTVHPTTPCLLNHNILKCHIYMFFWNTSRDRDSTTPLGSRFQCLTTLSVEKFFLISNLNLPWHNLKPLPLILSLVTWEKDTHLTTTSFQAVGEQ